MNKIFEYLKDLGVGGLVVGGFVAICLLLYAIVKYSPGWLLGGLVFIFFASVIGHALRNNL